MPLIFIPSCISFLITSLVAQIVEIPPAMLETWVFGGPKSLQMVTAAMKLKDAYSLEKSYDQPR